MTTDYVFEMKREKRSDGSVLISSPDLPMFSAIGKNESDALDKALSILREYLKANVPDFVQLRVAPPTKEIISWDASGTQDPSVIPAHVIATVKGREHATRGTTGS